MASKPLKISIGGLISFLILILAYWFKESNHVSLKVRVDLTHDSLIEIEKSVSVDPTIRIAVGYGACQDVIVKSKYVMDHIQPPEEGKHFDSVSNHEELSQLFAYFFQHGAAAERYINNMSLFTSILKLANEAEDVRKALGGNAAVMACRFAKEGIAQVLLGSQMSNELKKLIPSDVTVSGPVVDQDDTHLSLEYAAQESWGKYVSPRANRLFLHSDVHNPQIACMENFHAKMEKFNPDLLVVSALHMLDNFPSEYEIRRERIAKLASSLALFKKQNKKLKIHFEMASFTEEALMQDLVSLLLPHVDSLGMNEQELPNLYHILAFGNVTLVSDAYPRVATVLDLMRDVYDLIYTRTKGRLSRIHVHTLPFQAILTRKDTSWKHSLEASAKAALTAHRHTCGSDVIDTDKAKIIMDDSFTTSKDEGQRHRIPFDAKHPVACWQESISWNRHAVSICVAPVLVCTKVKQTGGGGDNVSAAGLVLQV